MIREELCTFALISNLTSSTRELLKVGADSFPSPQLLTGETPLQSALTRKC